MKNEKKELTQEELKKQLEEVEKKIDEEFTKAYEELRNKFNRSHAFVYQSGVAGQPLKGVLVVIRK